MSAPGITTAGSPAVSTGVDRDASDAPAADATPQPIITLGHSVTVAGVLAALLLPQPLLPTLLAAVPAPAVLRGPRASLSRRLGTRLFPRQNAAARAAGRVEDRRLVRFNDTLALSLLLLAQGAFLLGAPAVGWALALTLGVVAGIALAGFCLGCFLSHQLGLQRSRLLGYRSREGFRGLAGAGTMSPAGTADASGTRSASGVGRSTEGVEVAWCPDSSPAPSAGARGWRSRPGRVPPGQHLTADFPVLSAGPTPRTPLERWDFTVRGALDQPRRWTWAEFRALPAETVTVDIHCVTKWSKLDTVWQGVAVDTLLEGAALDGAYVVASCDGGYTTNLPLADVTGGKAWVVYEYDGKPLTPAHGGPARLLVPHLYFWKSAKWIRGLELVPQDRPGFWESLGYHNYGDVWREQRYQGD